MKNKILGYVILARDGSGFHTASEYPGDSPSLWFGNHLTLFATKRQARIHIDRTIAFAAERGYNWPWITDAVIHPIKAAK
jgi:hypothetical protein